MKTNVARLLTGMFALALLLAVGLSAQNSAQAAPGDITVDHEYLCSLAECAGDDTATPAVPATNTSGNIAVEDGTGTVEVLNLDVAKSSVTDPDDPDTPIMINPRTIAIDSAITVVQQFTDADDDNLPDEDNEIRAFNGNRIQIKYTPENGFATFKTILVDNVKPALVTISPEIPLVVKGDTPITFSAEITDTGSGYTSTVGTSAADKDIDDLNATPGPLAATAESALTPRGGVRLVVAGNVVSLSKDNFEKIDDGWRVSRKLDSSAIQNIGANVPWYFETQDRAGNTRRTSGSIPLKGEVQEGATGVGGITDARFAGGLPTASFTGTMMKVTRGSASKTVPISTFASSGAFTITITDDNFFLDDADPPAATDVEEDDKFELVGSNLLTIDSKSPRLKAPLATTGIVYSTSKKMPVRGTSAKANSIQVSFADDGKDDDDNAGSGLDPDTVTPSAFTVSGNTVNSVLVQGNDVYLTLGTNLAPDEQPTVSIASGMIKDKAGNAFGGQRIAKAADGLGPNLTLAEDADLSNKKVTVTITTDEQLDDLPTVTLGRVVDNDGKIVNAGDQECVYAAVPVGDPAADNPALSRLTRDLESDGTCLVPDAVADDDLNDRYTATTPTSVAGQPAADPDPSQTTALSYTYAVTAAAAVPAELKDGDDVIVKGFGGKYNVYVQGVDIQDEENMSEVGHKSDANNSAAFTFQLDTTLNGSMDPVVTVSDKTAVSGDADPPGVETISPMIVTVDWKGEAGEYPGDSYKKVTLTEAKLKITFVDGSSESRTFDLTTEVSSQDSIKYTVPLLSPKVGAYALTVKGQDSAGNKSGTSGHTAKWNVTAARPVDVDLKPGWNLISLPFQPANPAINSVIPADHPVSLVMTFDSAEGVWLFSRRDAETGNFTGDVSVITASRAYFVNTDSFKALSLFRPPSATAAAAPAQPPAIPVKKGWNLVPVSSNQTPVPKGIDADTYFGTLGETWLRALAWDPLGRAWIAVSRSVTGRMNYDRDIGEAGVPAATDEGDGTGTDRCGVDHTNKGTTAMRVPAQVCRGEGLWLWVTEDGTLIPG